MNPASSTVSVVPSYPAPDFVALKTLAEDIAGVCDELQVDIVDGTFVPAESWPFTESVPAVDALGRLNELPDSLALEVDCMVREPLQYLDTLAMLNVARVIVHHQSTDEYDACIAHAREHGYLIGLAVLPTVAMEEVRELILKFDYVQVMGIREVGKQGQAFAPEALTLIAALRAAFPAMEIAVDGAVNASTIPKLVAAGATRLAPGSAVVSEADRATALSALTVLAREHYPHGEQ